MMAATDSTTQNKDTYQEISAVARQRRDAKIAAYFPKIEVDVAKLPDNLTEWALTSGHYETEELEIIQTEAVDLLQKVRDRIWTSLEVTKAFCKASAFAQLMTNCLTEVLYEEAFERAKFLDGHLERTGEVLGPLHGLPISLKDCFATVPHPSSVGLAAIANVPTTKDSTIVEMLRNAGAVFYVKTNIPTAMMMPETINNVWGETRSPLHKHLTPGGSSGGESALIAFRASPLGIGTDIGGSVRIPAGFCHLYGLKPSFGRFPVSGTISGIPGQEFILAVNGPMSRSLETIQFYCKTMLSEPISPWNYDHKCLPIPWRQNVIQPPGRKLRFGIVGTNDGLVNCHPPVERALATTKAKLEAAGHEVVIWPTDLHPTIVKNLLAAFFDFGGTAIVNKLALTGEPVFPSMSGYAAAAQAGESDLGPTKLREMVMRRNELQQTYVNLWNSSALEGKPPIDGIIMAVSPWAAPKLEHGERNIYVGYTGVWNFLDFAACTFPVTSVDKSIDMARDLASFQPLSEIDRKIQAEYDAAFYHGAPVSLQMIGRRLEEEKVLEMVEVVSKVLKDSK